MTNTKIKFIVVVDSANTALRENDVRGVRIAISIIRETTEFHFPSQMFRNLHIYYTDAVCNPFYTPGEPMTSKLFDKNVRTIMSGN